MPERRSCYAPGLEMKFVHAADLHIDSPLRGLERYEGAPAEQIRGATRRALEHLVELCLQEEVELLVLSGDLYDGGWKDYSTGLFFCERMAQLREGGVQVVWIRGNHDAASRLTQHLRPPENVRELAHGRPSTVRLELRSQHVAVHGQGFARERVTDDLTEKYPEPADGALNVGLLHTALDGREGHDRYAPCRVEALTNRGYDYWALGHVHRREIVHREPWVVFPGNLQGRHARETGPKGATLVSVVHGRIADVEHRALDEVRWAEVRVDAAQAQSADDVVDLVRQALQGELEGAEGRLLCTRVRVSGATRAHTALRADGERWQSEVRAVANDVARGAAWIEKVVLGTRPLGEPALLRARQDPLGALLRRLGDIKQDETELRFLSESLDEFRRKLPRELLEGPDAPQMASLEGLSALLEDVEGVLVPMLSEDGSE